MEHDQALERFTSLYLLRRCISSDIEVRAYLLVETSYSYVARRVEQQVVACPSSCLNVVAVVAAPCLLELER